MTARFTATVVGGWALLSLLLTATPAAASEGGAESDKPQLFDAARLARRAWALADLVLEHHIDPPTRQEMLLAGYKHLTRRSDLQKPYKMAERFSQIRTEAETTELLKEFLNPADPQKKGNATGVEDSYLRGMLEAVPGKPFLIEGHALRATEQAQSNQYVGTGIQVGFHQQEQLVQILNPFPGGPARIAGAKTGDLIVEVDGASMAGFPLAKVVERLRGEKGSKVQMRVRQPGAKDSRVLDMTRAEVPFETAVGFARSGETSWNYRIGEDPNLAYIRLESISTSTPGELSRIEKKLADKPVDGIILDLRGLAGGSMHDAALVADKWLDGGLMFQVRDAQNHKQEYRADRDCIFRGCPMVVLIDGRTAGSAEMLAAALQDNKRAQIVGVPSAGEPFDKTLLRLPNNDGGVELRTGIGERANPQSGLIGSRPAFVTEMMIGPSIKPNDLIEIGKGEMKSIYDWHRQQMAPPETTNLQQPVDQQLNKAKALLYDLFKMKTKP